MIKKLLILPDVHLTTTISKPYQIVKKFIKQNKFDETILLGDFMEVEALSGYDLSKKRKIEGKRFKKEISIANKELDYLQQHCKKIIYLSGNHEHRVERYLDDHSELEDMLELPTNLYLKQRNIKWLPINQPYTVGHISFIHGVYYNKYFARKTIENYSKCVCVGHTHRHQVSTTYPKLQKEPFICYGLGCLGDTDPAYKKNAPTGHINQFAVCYVDDKGLFNLYPINIINNRFIWNGKMYK